MLAGLDRLLSGASDGGAGLRRAQANLERLWIEPLGIHRRIPFRKVQKCGLSSDQQKHAELLHALRVGIELDKVGRRTCACQALPGFLSFAVERYVSWRVLAPLHLSLGVFL